MESFQIGDAVEAIYPGTDTFYPGIIHAVKTTDGVKDSFGVKFTEGELNKDYLEVKSVKPNDIISSQTIQQTRVFCQICEKSLSLSNNEYYCNCTKCHVVKPFHKKCFERYLECLFESKSEINNVLPHHNNFQDFTCSQCLLPCFLCGEQHYFSKSNAKLYNCPMCPSNDINKCIIIQPPRETRISCYTNLSEEKKKLFDNASYGCIECMNSKTLDYDTNLVLDDSITPDLDSSICQKIRQMIHNFGTDIDPISVPHDLGTVNEFFKKHLSHVNFRDDNIFTVTSPSPSPKFGLFLTFKSIQTFMSNEGSIDVLMMSFLLQLLNANEYFRLIDEPDKSIGNFEFIQYLHPSFDNSVNPLNSEHSLSRSVSTKSIFDEDTKTSMINDWQQDLIPHIQSERDFSILNSILPKLQSTNDEDEATEHIKKLNVFVPIHSKSSNWRCILIQFPSNDKFSNGVVNLYDLNDKKSGESSTLKGITMWYTKLFGMIWNNHRKVKYIHY